MTILDPISSGVVSLIPIPILPPCCLSVRIRFLLLHLRVALILIHLRTEVYLHLHRLVLVPVQIGITITD
jgi:hypothetical protein